MTLQEFLVQLVAALKEDPPKLINNTLTQEFGDWLLQHFSMYDLEKLAATEEAIGDGSLDKYLLDAFVEAGLPRPLLEG